MRSPTVHCTDLGHATIHSVRTSLSHDVNRYLNKSPENQAAGNTFKSRVSALLTPELMALSLYRISHYLCVNDWVVLARLLRRLNLLLHRVNISPQSCIGPGFHLPHPSGVMFHGTAGAGLTMFSMAICCSFEDSLDGPVGSGPSLGENVTLGAHAVLLGPITVGDQTKVAYSVRLDRSVPPAVLAICLSLRQSRKRTDTANELVAERRELER